MARTQSTASKAQRINDEVKGERVFDDDFLGIGRMNVSRVVTKCAIGYAYGVVAYIGGLNIINMVIIMTNMVWLQYIIAFVGLVALIMAIFKTAPLVADTLYDAGAFVASKAKKLFASTKEKVNGYKMPWTVSHVTH